MRLASAARKVSYSALPHPKRYPKQVVAPKGQGNPAYACTTVPTSRTAGRSATAAYQWSTSKTDPEWGHLFRCPAENCHHERYVKPEGRLLRIVGLLPRCSEEWKGEYKKRHIIERFFSSDKHSRMLDTHRYLNWTEGGVARDDVDAELPSHGAGASEGRRLRPHEAHEDQVATDADQGKLGGGAANYARHRCCPGDP